MPTTKTLSDLLSALPAISSQLTALRERLLANLVMIAQIAGGTYNEPRRIRFMLDRFIEKGLTEVTDDEAGNAFGVVKGKTSKRKIMVTAHVDNHMGFDTCFDVSVKNDKITGPGVADNALGAAMIATIPDMLEVLGIELESDLLLLGAVKSLGHGDLKGIRYFLDKTNYIINNAIAIEGHGVGRISHRSVGMLRGDICVAMPEFPQWDLLEHTSALTLMNIVVDRLLAIPLPQKPKTRLCLSSLNSGAGYELLPTEAKLGFELRSESDEVLTSILKLVEDIVFEYGSYETSAVKLDIFARRSACGLAFNHPMVKAILEVMKKVGIEPTQSFCTQEGAALLAKGIPTVTLGVTTGGNVGLESEYIDIRPMIAGVTQIIGAILAIDRGLCDES